MFIKTNINGITYCGEAQLTLEPKSLPNDLPDGAHGVIIEHRPAPETYGGVAVKTAIGSFAVVKKHQKQASENIGDSVRVRQVDSCYKTVEILDFNE